MPPETSDAKRLPAALDAAREQLKTLEGRLPLAVQGPLLRMFGAKYDPYTPRDHATRSIFVHVPKTAGSSMALALGSKKRHVPISRYAAFDARAYKNYFKFGFVRNPWDRLLSAYSYLYRSADKSYPFPAVVWARENIVQFPDFETFVLALREPRTRRRIMRYIHFRPQVDWVTLPGSSHVELDFIGRFERLAEDFARIAERLGKDPALPVTNASGSGSYKDAYSPETRAIAAQLYRADIEAFGYEY